jgi:hypothetical protein
MSTRRPHRLLKAAARGKADTDDLIHLAWVLAKRARPKDPDPRVNDYGLNLLAGAAGQLRRGTAPQAALWAAYTAWSKRLREARLSAGIAPPVYRDHA